MKRNMERQLRQERIKKKRRKRAIFMTLEIVVLCILSVVAYGMHKLGKLNHLEIKPQVSYKDLNLEDYTNVALFGLDAREGEVSGVRSDAIIVASIDNKNKTIKLISVYRDTFLQQRDGTYYKANDAYADGGPEESVELLNKNMDLNISEYASVNFKALADVIDLLGGISIDMTDEEIIHMNNYCVETSEITGLSYETIDPVPGTYKLNGVQAVSYARIRYTSGGDFKRTQRQRIVLEKMMEKVKKAGILKLNKIIDKVMPEVTTSLDLSEILKMAEYMITYDMGESKGFPFEVATPDSIPGYSGSYVVPVNLAANVKELHSFLFPGESYEPSDKVKAISDDIIYLTGIDLSSDGENLEQEQEQELPIIDEYEMEEASGEE